MNSLAFLSHDGISIHIPPCHMCPKASSEARRMHRRRQGPISWLVATVHIWSFTSLLRYMVGLIAERISRCCLHMEQLNSRNTGARSDFHHNDDTTFALEGKYYMLVRIRKLCLTTNFVCKHTYDYYKLYKLLFAWPHIRIQQQKP